MENRFLQLHLLTSYPPSNLNRDDMGRPKTALMGGVNRLRVSSQSLKRAWRKSELFEDALGEHLGTRTKSMGKLIAQTLLDKGIAEKAAYQWASQIAECFGKLKKDKDDKSKLAVINIEQLAHFSPEEQADIMTLVDTIAERNSGPEADELHLLRNNSRAVDIAMFGRMLASHPAYNVEAAIQVAHAIGVHATAVEDDFFTAVDDLNSGQEDLGAGHMGDTEFAAGLFYLYICVDRSLLSKNLQDDEALAKKAIAAMVESAATVAPTGKQNSFASRARASYILCETGNQQPRSLSVAFIKPVTEYKEGMLNNAIAALQKARDDMDHAYGACADKRSEMNVPAAQGSLTDIIDTAQD